jgi:hypothetical protein
MVALVAKPCGELFRRIFNGDVNRVAGCDWDGVVLLKGWEVAVAVAIADLPCRGPGSKKSVAWFQDQLVVEEGMSPAGTLKIDQVPGESLMSGGLLAQS